MDHGWKLCEKKKKVMLDGKMGKVAKGEKKTKRKEKEKEKEKKRKENKIKVSFVFLRFYVDGA
jgi:hypothetical protein